MYVIEGFAGDGGGCGGAGLEGENKCNHLLIFFVLPLNIIIYETINYDQTGMRVSIPTHGTFSSFYECVCLFVCECECVLSLYNLRSS